MAFKPLLPKTEYMRLPIPDYSEIKPPASSTVGLPMSPASKVDHGHQADGAVSPQTKLTMNFSGIFNLDPTQQAAVAGFALWLASEVIGMSRLKDNSLVQMVLGLLTRRFPAPVPPPAPRVESPESPSPAPKRRGRPPGSTSSRSSRAKASR